MKKIEPCKVLLNGVENPFTIQYTRFYSTTLGRTLLVSTFFYEFLHRTHQGNFIDDKSALIRCDKNANCYEIKRTLTL
jgi:hypothetical protein